MLRAFAPPLLPGLRDVVDFTLSTRGASACGPPPSRASQPGVCRGGRQEGAEKINSNKFGLRIKIKGYRGIGSPQPFILPHLCYPFSMLRLSTFDLTVRQDHPPSPRYRGKCARALFFPAWFGRSPNRGVASKTFSRLKRNRHYIRTPSFQLNIGSSSPLEHVGC